jgi:cell division protein FtsB
MSSPLPQTRVRVQRIAEAAVERARLTVVPRSRVRAPRVPFVTLVSLVLLAGVVGLLMFNTTMQQNSFTVTDLEAQAAELRSQEQTLQADIEHFQDPQYIGEQAQRLGMVQATCPRFLDLATDSVSAACPNPPEKLDVLPPKAKKPKSLVPNVIEIKARPKHTKKTADTRRQHSDGRRNAGSNGKPGTEDSPELRTARN